MFILCTILKGKNIDCRRGYLGCAKKKDI
uniref:Uncharacterized protein n=1 Tax=Arundo donax TaxID=35708 RepID=A0A0A9A938_ARUDO